jgi:hypothetical protein
MSAPPGPGYQGKPDPHMGNLDSGLQTPGQPQARKPEPRDGDPWAGWQRHPALGLVIPPKPTPPAHPTPPTPLPPKEK